MIFIVTGPQACGKTKNAEQLAKHFGAAEVQDEWDGNKRTLRKPVDGGNLLVLTFTPMESLVRRKVIAWDGVKRIISFDLAMREIETAN